MSQGQFQKNISRELAYVNEMIDRKILRGESYKRESLRHKALLAQMRRMKRDQSWFSVFSSFMYN